MPFLTGNGNPVILFNEAECGSGAAVARLLAKEKVASSNLVFRSTGKPNVLPLLLNAGVAKRQTQAT